MILEIICNRIKNPKLTSLIYKRPSAVLIQIVLWCMTASFNYP